MYTLRELFDKIRQYVYELRLLQYVLYEIMMYFFYILRCNLQGCMTVHCHGGFYVFVSLFILFLGVKFPLNLGKVSFLLWDSKFFFIVKQ